MGTVDDGDAATKSDRAATGPHASHETPKHDEAATIRIGPEDSAPTPARDAGPAEGSAIGRYVVLERLGQGAMGLVLRAYDPKLRREVALKMLRTDADHAGEEIDGAWSDSRRQALRAGLLATGARHAATTTEVARRSSTSCPRGITARI